MPPKTNQNCSKKNKIKAPIIDAMAECVFPEDIMASILTRLPVKSILRFKCVCKPWLNLFSTPHFIKTHHHHLSNHPQNQAVLISSICPENHHTISLFNLDSDQNPTNLDHPFFQGLAEMDFVGCVNGVVCLSNPPYGQWIDLWKPATSLSRNLPHPKVDHGKEDMVSLGFGYDADVDDFKVVRIVCFKDKKKNGMNRVEVYSANSDSWTAIDAGFDFRVLATKSAAVVNGNPYWIAIRDQENESRSVEISVCFFDVTKMVFNFLSLWTLDVGEIEKSPLVDWNGSLSLLAWKKKDEMVRSIDVWVFDDGKKMWTLKHTFGPVQLKVDRIMQCSKNGKILGECSDGKLFVFDSVNGCVKEFVIAGAHKYTFDIHGYAESLACIKGMEKVDVTKRW